jgi:hypothetical protein
VTEHGILLDYGTYLTSAKLVPVSGLTVTDGDQSTTSDAQGRWSLTMPAGAVLAPTVTGTSKGDAYSTLLLPSATAAGTDVDRGNIIFPDQSTFMIEQQILSSDTSGAIVQVVAVATGSCTSVAGGTITVTSPAGAKVMYFNDTGTPSSAQTSFAGLTDGKSVAAIYDVSPGADLQLTVSHPTCKQAPWPATLTGAAFDGKVTTKAAEPGDYNSGLVVQLQ